MLKKLNWEVFSYGERNKSIDEIKEIISKNDGYIMNFNMFSDLAMSLSVEVPENKIVELHKGLSILSGVSDLNFESIDATSTKEWMLLINLFFVKGTGNMKNEIPEVPG